MIIDVTGTILTPGNHGKDCLGNGEHFDEDGDPYDLCCDECDYMMCCYCDNWEKNARNAKRQNVRETVKAKIETSRISMRKFGSSL